MGSRLFGDVRFAMVPEWVLYHEQLSDRAKVLWGVLQRHAGADGRPTPSRQRLADCLGHCSVDSVDRAKRELVKVGALLVYNRHDERTGEPLPNDYVLVHDPLEAEQLIEQSRTGAARGRTAAATSPQTEHEGGRTAAAQKRVTPESTPETAAVASDSDARPAVLAARRLVQTHWERCKTERRPTPVLKRDRAGSPFMALVKIVETLLDAGWPDVDVAAALWDTTGGHTLQGLGVELTKRRARDERSAIVDRYGSSLQPELGSRPLWSDRADCELCDGVGMRFDEQAAAAVRCECNPDSATG